MWQSRFRKCVKPVAEGYSNSPCLIAGGHLSATSGSTQASCKAWVPTSVGGAPEAACAEPRSSWGRHWRWLQAGMTSSTVQCLSGQVPVCEFEPSCLKSRGIRNVTEQMECRTKHIHNTSSQINVIYNKQKSSGRLSTARWSPRKNLANWIASEHVYLVFSPTYLPPGLMTMAALLRVSSSTCAMLSLAFW